MYSNSLILKLHKGAILELIIQLTGLTQTPEYSRQVHGLREQRGRGAVADPGRHLPRQEGHQEERTQRPRGIKRRNTFNLS